LSQLVVQSILVRLEVTDVLAINLILLTLRLDFLGLPVELLLLDAVLVELLLQCIILGNYSIVPVIKRGLFLLEGALCP